MCVCVCVCVCVCGPRTQAHATFDVVILNSHYSLNWYQTYSVPVYHDEHAIRKLFPRMQVRHCTRPCPSMQPRPRWPLIPA